MFARAVSLLFMVGVGLIAKGLFFTGSTHCDAPDRFGYQLCTTPEPSKGFWMLFGAALIGASFLIYLVGARIQRRRMMRFVLDQERARAKDVRGH